MKIYTTLNRIKQEEPCSEGWTKLLSFLNKTKSDNDPLDLLTILESNGVEDCIWAFKYTDNHDNIYRHIAADFAESVLHIYEAEYPNDNRPRLAIQAARDFADGKINNADRAAARVDAARAADNAWSAVVAARAADNAWSAVVAAVAAARVDAASAVLVAAAYATDAYSDARAAELEKQKAIIIKWLS
jgi:hypothetical protein